VQAFIGVDVGGTHTDVCVAMGGRIERGKAVTTYDDFSRGLLEAVGVAAERFELTVEQLLARTRLFVNGTTVVTNAITQLRGARVGVFVTAGFTDTFRIAGGARLPEFDDQLQRNVPDLTPREAIVGIDERIDWAGEVLVRLDLDQIRAGARRLVEEVGVDAFSICFLSSYANGEHELAAEQAIRELYPDMFITVSHRIFPVVGSYRRWTTALLNSFVHASAEIYLDSLAVKLHESGLTGGLAFFQGLGGGISLRKAKDYPLALLGSGPAAGAIGANELAKRMGYTKLLLGDMGGTSFDTGIINANQIAIEKNLQIGQFETGVNVVDVVSVGAGGGSVAWISERGVPQVGPRSAGSTPGPASLGKGGEEPTVTDAMVTMGFIDPERYLDGRVKLQPELGRQALEGTLGERFGWDADEAAAAVHDLVVVNMANAVREVSVQKGHDPRDFMFLAYGGTLPLFASQIAERLSIPTILIPQNSSVFCALGLLSADFVLRTDQGIGWDLSKAEEVGRVNDIAERMIAEIKREMLADGFAEEEVRIVRSGDFRFQGQDYELTMPVPDRPLIAADAPRLADEFRALYESTYGEGTAWAGVATRMVNYSVTAIGRQPRPDFDTVALDGAPGAAPVREQREVYLPSLRRREKVSIHDETQLGAGVKVDGPAIIDARDTTIYVPPGTVATRDEYLNFVLSRPPAAVERSTA
jgi:N-methylhydantoinase A